MRSRTRRPACLRCGATLQFALVRAWIVPVADAGRGGRDGVDGGRGLVVLHEIAVQHVFGELAGPAQRLDPVEAVDASIRDTIARVVC